MAVVQAPCNHFGEPSALSIEDKQKVLDVITVLRNYQLIGIVEARNWIELLFPEFANIRDTEADELFDQLARLSAGREEVTSDSARQQE